MILLGFLFCLGVLLCGCFLKFCKNTYSAEWNKIAMFTKDQSKSLNDLNTTANQIGGPDRYGYNNPSMRAHNPGDITSSLTRITNPISNTFNGSDPAQGLSGVGSAVREVNRWM
jgi:hypothetical protein